MCAASALGHVVLAAGLLAAHVAAFAPSGGAPTPRVQLRRVLSSLPAGLDRRPSSRPPAHVAPLRARVRLSMDDLALDAHLDLNESILIIDSIAQCQVAVVSLLKRAAKREAFGVDVLHTNDNISLISFAEESGKLVVVFDIHSLHGQAFQPLATGGGLRWLLESPHVNKVFFDAAPGADALLLQFDVRLENAWDVQALYSNLTGDPAPAWAHVLGEFLGVAGATPNASEQLRGIGGRGAELLRPGNISDGDIWTQRPMHPDMLEYTVAKVRFLPDMWDYFMYMNEIDKRPPPRRDTRRQGRIYFF
mmetsp:Transcript_109217/g.308964  ORF Transcript_109217/g.308964 Transcript_109217/m.308964 type:complete len:306 (-) Transcript_109217:40-957(-)